VSGRSGGSHHQRAYLKPPASDASALVSWNKVARHGGRGCYRRSGEAGRASRPEVGRAGVLPRAASASRVALPCARWPTQESAGRAAETRWSTRRVAEAKGAVVIEEVKGISDNVRTPPARWYCSPRRLIDGLLAGVRSRWRTPACRRLRSHRSSARTVTRVASQGQGCSRCRGRGPSRRRWWCCRSRWTR
jgi:hypothetical protein